MKEEPNCTIKKFKFFYTKDFHDTNGNVIRSEAYDNESDECYMTTDYFYDEYGRLIREEKIVNNEREHSHTKTSFRDERDCHIIESITRYENPAPNQRDERRVEVYHDSRLAVRTYDLKTGELISDELYDGEECLYDVSRSIQQIRLLPHTKKTA